MNQKRKKIAPLNNGTVSNAYQKKMNLKELTWLYGF